MGPVLLFDVGIVVIFVGAREGELDSAASWALLTEGKKVGVDELAAVVGVDPPKAEGSWCSISVTAFKIPKALLPMTALRSTQQVAMSTQSRLWRNSQTASHPNDRF